MAQYIQAKQSFAEPGHKTWEAVKAAVVALHLFPRDCLGGDCVRG